MLRCAWNGIASMPSSPSTYCIGGEAAMEQYHGMFRKRSRVLMFSAAIFWLVVIVRAAILTVGASNHLRSDLALMNRTPRSLIALGEQVEVLNRIATDIDNYNLGQIKTELATTAYLAGTAQVEFQAQYEAWVSVRGQTSKDKASYLELRQRMDELQHLQDSELVRLKNLLDHATKPTMLSDVVNMALSFFLGVVSSIFASHLYDRWKSRDKNTVGNA
jgi:hypothetical protein